VIPVDRVVVDLVPEHHAVLADELDPDAGPVDAYVSASTVSPLLSVKLVGSTPRKNGVVPVTLPLE
jgi:hypothetical protein